MPRLTVDKLDTLDKFIAEVPLALLYFGAPTCGICTAVKPKIEALCEARFPRLLHIEIDRDAAPAVAAAWRVFSLPTIVVLTGGKESRRFVRAFSIESVAEAVARPYALAYADEP